MSFIKNHIQTFLFIIATLLFVAGFILAYQEKNAGSISTYGAGVLCLIFAFLTNFKRFKGLGIEAETWEEKMEEANKLIEQLKRLATNVSGPLLTLVAGSRRVRSPFSRKELISVQKEVVSLLKEIGVADDEIQKTQFKWHIYAMMDLADIILKKLAKTISELTQEKQKKIQNSIPDAPKELIEEFHELEEKHKACRNEFFHNLFDWEKKIDTFLNDKDIFSDLEKEKFLKENKEEIEDLRYYARNKKHRRPETWIAEE